MGKHFSDAHRFFRRLVRRRFGTIDAGPSLRRLREGGNFALDADELTAWIAAFFQPVRVDESGNVVVRTGQDFREEVFACHDRRSGSRCVLFLLYLWRPEKKGRPQRWDGLPRPSLSQRPGQEARPTILQK